MHHLKVHKSKWLPLTAQVHLSRIFLHRSVILFQWPFQHLRLVSAAAGRLSPGKAPAAWSKSALLKIERNSLNNRALVHDKVTLHGIWSPLHTHMDTHTHTPTHSLSSSFSLRDNIDYLWDTCITWTVVCVPWCYIPLSHDLSMWHVWVFSNYVDMLSITGTLWFGVIISQLSLVLFCTAFIF